MKMIAQIFVISLTIGMAFSAPAANPNPEPQPTPAADPAPAPAPKPGLAPLIYSPPMALSYSALSTLQTHPSSLVVKSAPTAAVVPAVSGLSALPTVYTLQAQAAPALGYAVNYPYVVV